jgi:hypothetical protein
VRQLGPLVRRTGIGWPRWSRDGIRIGYDGGGSVSVVKVATLDRTRVPKGLVPGSVRQRHAGDGLVNPSGSRSIEEEGWEG